MRERLDARVRLPPIYCGGLRCRDGPVRGVLLLLNSVQIIDNRKDSCSHHDLPQIPGRIERVIGRIDNVRQALDGVESFPPNRHFMRAVRGNCSPPVYGFVNGSNRKDPVVVLGQGRQIGRRHLQLPSNRSFALSIHAMAACARSLKFCLANIGVCSVSGRGETSGQTGNHERLQTIDNHIMPQFFG
ncbi:hypothetical protein AB7M49_001170 [Bradyrhizobium elkanii]